MADSSLALPISPNATRDQLLFIRDWHDEQVTHLDHNKGPNRDEKSILRSEGICRNINRMLINVGNKEPRTVYDVYDG